VVVVVVAIIIVQIRFVLQLMQTHPEPYIYILYNTLEILTHPEPYIYIILHIRNTNRP